MENRPKVGVGVVVRKDNKVLLGQRKNSHGEGSWCFPGGHLEFGESWEQCAKREVEEETGLKIKNVHLGKVTNDIFETENKHYITLIMVADYDEGETEVKEIEKCERWEWFEWNHLPTPLFIPIQNLQKTDFNPF